MVVIKYSKLGLGAFIGEEEMLDCWKRVANRAGIKFCEGDFDLKLFYPASLGVESDKEYLIVNTALDEVRVKSKINELFPDWIKIIDAYNLDDLNDLMQHSTRDVLIISFNRLKENEEGITRAFQEQKDAKNIIDFRIENGKVKVAIRSILSNTMCDIIAQILTSVNLPLDYSIVRQKLLLETSEKLMEVDEFLQENEKETY